MSTNGSFIIAVETARDRVETIWEPSLDTDTHLMVDSTFRALNEGNKDDGGCNVTNSFM